MREELINAILNLASDEYQTKEDIIKLAFKSENELIKDLINIAEYYQEQNNLLNN